MSKQETKAITALFPNQLSPMKQAILREIKKIVTGRLNYLNWDQKQLFYSYRGFNEIAFHAPLPLKASRSLEWTLSAFCLHMSKQEEHLHPEMKWMIAHLLLTAEHQGELNEHHEKLWLAKLQDAVGNDVGSGEQSRLVLLLKDDGAHLHIVHGDNSVFLPAKVADLRQMLESAYHRRVSYDAVTMQILQVATDYRSSSPERHLYFSDSNLKKLLAYLLSDPSLMAQSLYFGEGVPVPYHAEPLVWSYQQTEKDDFIFHLLEPDGRAVKMPWVSISAKKSHLLTATGWHCVPFLPSNLASTPLPWVVPRSAIMSHAGYALLRKMGVSIPEAMASKVQRHEYAVVVKCSVHRSSYGQEMMRLQADAVIKRSGETHRWREGDWQLVQPANATKDLIIEADDSIMRATAPWLRELPLKSDRYRDVNYQEMRLTKAFPELMADWLARRPAGIELLLDEELNELLHGSVSGRVSIEIEESTHGLDWFDIKVQVRFSDEELTQEEISLLLKAKGKWVKLGKKGWRKLEYQVSDEVQQELAEIGLSAHDLHGEKQSMHALQLGALAKRQSSLLAEQDQQRLCMRLEDIQTRVTPTVPSTIEAQLRPYQEEGFHFLAYLSTNQFGGVLADDMGLGKTLQALTWLAWLREKHRAEKKSEPRPTLVVAPKSVQENWQTETQRFCSALRCKVWRSGDSEDELKPEGFDILIVNYAQLRHWSDEIKAISWQTVIVDEAQNIKNPTSQSTLCVRALSAEHRLALTGTPIENRLMDLWSIFSFAMPGVLGSRAAFTKRFDKSNDQLARKRLSALTRPFLMRRTKKEVAQDLPDRIEEDMSVTLDGVQAKLYQAELKRARAHLLKAKVPGQLDQMRFHLLSSLLRLRQICCHPALLGASEPEASTSTPRKRAKKFAQKEANPTESAKLDALVDLLEPLIEEGQKVLVFSQFVGMLDLIRGELVARQWRNFYLTGQTNDRGALVADFQNCEDAAVFLISLKAGGAGLNLTAASYVVLFDPWWNPAVEAQAIDRTHRIGQKSTVIAYRLVAKDTIEEKIRQLQQLKSAMAQDILGEENFAQALTLDDFQFLLSDQSMDPRP